MIVDLVRLSF